jgi:uncharacterized protein YjbI with pentapeptide repeats
MSILQRYATGERNFAGAQLAEAPLAQAILAGVNLSQGLLSRADLDQADLQGANLKGADLQNAKLKQVCLAWANLESADLRGANLTAANLEHANLCRADLSRAILSGADLRDAELKHTNLSRTNLSGANLSGANLRWVDLSGANLRWADLSEAKLSGATLTGADLSNAILSEASLVHADLTQANLSRVNWIGADLSSANLTGAKLFETPRFGLKTEEMTCEWVDLSPAGDRSQIYNFKGNEARSFFRERVPTMRIAIDAPLDHYSQFVLASTCHQLSRKFPVSHLPPSFSVGDRRTVITIQSADESSLAAIAYVMILPFKDAIATQQRIGDLLGLCQRQQDLSPQRQQQIRAMHDRLQPLLGKLPALRLPIPENRANFFEAPTQTTLINSAGQTLTLYHHPQFGKRIVNISGTITRSMGLTAESGRSSGWNWERVAPFINGFYDLPL